MLSPSLDTLGWHLLSMKGRLLLQQFPCHTGEQSSGAACLEKASKHQVSALAFNISGLCPTCDTEPLNTFWETLGVAVDLQGIQRTDLEFNMVVQELLHHGLERQQKLFLLIQLLFAGGSKLLLLFVARENLICNVLQKTSRREDHKYGIK